MFRKKALMARRSQPIDQIPRIIPSYGWMFVVGVLIFLTGVFIWSLVGEIPTTVQGRGIVLSGGKVPSITSQGQGRVAELLVDVGDKVEPGQVVAKIDQPTIEAQIRTQEILVKNLRNRLKTVQEQANSLLTSQMKFLEKQQKAAETTIDDYKTQIESLKKVVDAQQKLLNDGLIPLTTFISSQTLLDNTQIELLAAENQLQSIESQEIDYRATAETDVFQAQINLENAQSELAELKAELAEGASVVSTLSGTVVGVNVTLGGEVTIGTPVFDIERTGEDLSAVLYFLAGPGKRIEPGMIAQVSPDTVPIDQYGFIVGEVTRVSDVPATEGSMMAYLSNENVVESLVMTGPQVQVLANLKKDPSTESGFEWSSSTGPPRSVPSGTMATARVIVEEQRPITLLVPLLKELFGIVK